MPGKTTLILAATAAIGLSACTNPDGTANNAGTGGLIGAGVGAVAGGLIGGDARGAAIGAAAGGALGLVGGAILDEQERRMRQQLQGSGATIVNTGEQLIVSLPEAITFDVDSTQVKQNSRRNIRAIAQNLQEYPNSGVQVLGHADSTGTDAYNIQLSQGRANAVRTILVNNGVAPGRIVARGLGESQPVASNATAAGREANRRVEIVITPRA